MQTIPMIPRDVLIFEWAFVLLAAIFVCLRVYVRLRQHLLSIGDATIILTLVCFIITAVCDTIMVIDGFSSPEVTLDPADPQSAYAVIPTPLLRGLLKMLYASTVPYYTSLWLVKVTLVLLYYQLMPAGGVNKKLKVALHVTAVIVAVSYIVVILENLLWCLPIDTNWETDFSTPTKMKRYCVAYFASQPYILSVSLHAFTELLVFGFPFTLLRVLRFNRRTYRAVAIIFAVGFLGVIISLTRITCTFLASHGPVISIWQAWAAAEQSVGIVVCCLPAFKRLVTGSIGSRNSDGGTLALVQDQTPPMKRISPNGSLAGVGGGEKRLVRIASSMDIIRDSFILADEEEVPLQPPHARCADEVNSTPARRPGWFEP